ncbi:MAG: AmmeMemoRadiSam system protein B [Candidatus Acetothermia bacterium]
MSNKFGPVVAGKFYPGKRESLLKRIGACYTDGHGPGEAPDPVDRDLDGDLGIIAPHAGYKFSGPVAAHAYGWLARHGRPAAVVILGTNHTGFGPGAAIATEGSWATPLGDVPIDEELARSIFEESDELRNRTAAFSREHSIEVQLPFLQHLWGSWKGALSFVPICLKDQSRSVAEDVGKALEEATPRGTLVVASTDFSHYESQEVAVEKDGMAIEAIVEGDLEGLYGNISEHDISICGYGAAASLMTFAYIRGLDPEELKYATSGDVSGFGEEVVGYSAIGFE